MYTIYWNQEVLPHYMYNTFLSLLPPILNPKTEFEITPWGFTLGGERGVYVEHRKTLAYTKVYDVHLTDLFKVLILMVEFGAASKLMYDAPASEFLLALEQVNTIYPLSSYEKQKHKNRNIKT
jgi:hypothetical protein